MVVLVAVMPAATIRAVLVGVVMRVIVGMIMAVAVMRVAMVMMAVVVMIMIAVMDALFRLEAPLDRCRDAALPAGQFGESGAVFDIEGVAGEFGKAVLAAEMPGEAHEAERVFGPHFQKLFGGGFHLNELAILEPQGVAVVDHRLHVEIEMDVRPLLAGQMRMAPASRRMIEGDRIDHAVELDGGLADDGGDAGHDLSLGEGSGWA
jgi:hypothetical protein